MSLYCYRCQETSDETITANCPICDMDDLTETIG